MIHPGFIEKSVMKVFNGYCLTNKALKGLKGNRERMVFISEAQGNRYLPG